MGSCSLGPWDFRDIDAVGGLTLGADPVVSVLNDPHKTTQPLMKHCRVTYLEPQNYEPVDAAFGEPVTLQYARPTTRRFAWTSAYFHNIDRFGFIWVSDHSAPNVAFFDEEVARELRLAGFGVDLQLVPWP